MNATPRRRTPYFRARRPTEQTKAALMVSIGLAAIRATPQPSDTLGIHGTSAA
jgi:hypothetical protein